MLIWFYTPLSDYSSLRMPLNNERSGALRLQQPGHCNNIALALFKFRALRLWNDLLWTIAKAESLGCFKKYLKSVFLSLNV